MKLSTILPALVASAKKRENQKNGKKEVDGDRFVASAVTEECSSVIPNLGGIFEVTNNGRSGEVNLDNYPDRVQCQQVVQADSSCQAIKITYQSIAVEPHFYDDCANDGFRIGWTGTNELNVSPPVCNCYGDGCEREDNELHDDFWYYEEYAEKHLGPTEYSVNSNTFTFFFKSDGSFSDGHVLLDWECVDEDSAAPIDIVTLISGSAENCYEHQTTYEEFRDRVRNGIAQGLENDIDDFSKKPGQVTAKARNRINQFKQWFYNIFEVWYTDIETSRYGGMRQCLADKFPHDSPGFVGKESVLSMIDYHRT